MSSATLASLASPISRLSSELLSTIFLLALDTELASPTHSENWQHGQSQLARTPLVVSQVSKQWRTCALATAQLWRVVQVGHVRKSAQDQGRWTSAELTTLWLERAKGTMLDLRIVFGQVAQPPQPGAGKKNKNRRKPRALPIDTRLEYLLQILRDHVHRCVRLRVTLDSEHRAFPILRALADARSESVLTVELSKPESIDITKITYSPHIFINLWPNLRHLTMIGLHPPTSPEFLRALRSLRIESCPASSIDVDALLSCLRACPELTDLHLSDIEHDFSDPDTTDKFVARIPTTKRNLEHPPFPSPPSALSLPLPNLSALHLRLVPMFWARLLASRLSAPALRTLTIAQFMMDDGYNIMGPDGLPSATLGIRHLDLGGVEVFEWPAERWGADLTGKRDVEFLLAQQLRGVRTLVLDTKLSSVFLHVLTQDALSPSEEPGLCPELETLCGGFSTPRLIALLSARRARPIRTLRLSKHTPPEEVDQLKGLAEDVSADGEYTAYEDLLEEDGLEGRVEEELEEDGESEEEEEGWSEEGF